MPAASSDIQLKIARIAPAVLLVAGLSVMFWLYRSLGTEGLISLQESLNPVLFFSSLAVLITFGMPATPFILLASSIFSAPVAALGCGLTLLAHLLLTWWLAHGVLRRYIQGLVAKFQKKRSIDPLPESEARKRALRTAILIKLAPGVPMFVKHFSMALVGLPFPQYLMLAWAVSMAYASGFVFIGQAYAEGDWTLLIIGVGIIALAATCLFWLRRNFTEEAADLSDKYETTEACAEK